MKRLACMSSLFTNPHVGCALCISISRCRLFFASAILGASGVPWQMWRANAVVPGPRIRPRAATGQTNDSAREGCSSTLRRGSNTCRLCLLLHAAVHIDVRGVHGPATVYCTRGALARHRRWKQAAEHPWQIVAPSTALSSWGLLPRVLRGSLGEHGLGTQRRFVTLSLTTGTHRSRTGGLLNPIWLVMPHIAYTACRVSVPCPEGTMLRHGTVAVILQWALT